MLPQRTFRFSWKITLIGLVLTVGMIRASIWQWERHQQKEIYLKELDARISEPPSPLPQLWARYQNSPDKLLHRRAVVSGSFDFEHEIVLRNRKDDRDGPGVHVITPLAIQLDGTTHHLLVNRGYLPLSVQPREKRKAFQRSTPPPRTLLHKTSETPRALAPNDPPTGAGRPWVDAWLRVNIEKIEKQMPYNLLPIFGEIMSSAEALEEREAIVKGSKGREEILFLTERSFSISDGSLDPNRTYPVPAYSTVVPSATHLAYVYEWAFMALLTVLICAVLQFRKGGVLPGAIE